VIRLLILVSLVFPIAFSAQQQDLKQNFHPLKSAGILPDVFTQNIREVIKQDITDLKQKKDKDKTVKSSFLTASNYQIERILRSGNTLVNDEITDYLNEVADVILKDNPTLRKQLHIFTLKSAVVNAYSFDKGFIFIDIGLIAQVESEAQLAYILCHEICHFTKQHHINSFVINDRIDKDTYDGNTESKYIEKCQYSKEYESEADMEGFRLFERTTYDLKQAEKGFTVLQYSHLPFELIEFKKSIFETPNYQIPNRYLLAEVSAIKDNSDEDDSKLTHPNTKKRRIAIAEVISQRDNSKRVKAIVGQSRFEYVRDLSRMELCRLYLKVRDYPNSLYASYILTKKYPDNVYVAEVMAKSLYGLALYTNGEIKYTNDSYLERGVVSYSEIESFPQQIYHLVEKMPANEWAIMTLGHTYRLHQKFPKSKKLLAITDSMFTLMSRIDWGITDFARIPKVQGNPAQINGSTDTLTELKSKTELIVSLQKEKSDKAEDSVYYKTAFVDLFVGDPEFTKKFPISGGSSKISSSFKDFTIGGYRGKNQKNLALKIKTPIDTVLLLEPFYIRIDEREKQSVQYVRSDEKQEDYIQTIDECARLQDMVCVKMDPGLIGTNDADKMNDFSVINDWFDERFDADAEGRSILNTDEIDAVVKKYNTSFVLKTGIASVISRSGAKRTYFFGFLFDLKRNQMVYRKYEIFHKKDQWDMVRSKAYQMIFELRHPKRRSEEET
jgi:hypothetical protein